MYRMVCRLIMLWALGGARVEPKAGICDPALVFVCSYASRGAPATWRLEGNRHEPRVNEMLDGDPYCFKQKNRSWRLALPVFLVSLMFVVVPGRFWRI